MARRPQPTHRSPQAATPRQYLNVLQSKAQLARQARPKAFDFLSELAGAGHAHSSIARLEKLSDDDDTSVDSDTDAPRVAQWIDDDDFELQEQMDETSESDSKGADDDLSASETGRSRKLRSLEHDLSTLPLGTLRSAQHSLAQAHTLNDTESDSEVHSEGNFSASEDDNPSLHPTKGKHVETSNQPSKLTNGPVKRSNKHAPVEVTSKRPVSRGRTVVDDKLPKPRDPRFMHAAGRYDPIKFKQRYEFLSDLRNDELATLRGNFKRARKLLANSPARLRADREDEVKRLERAMKRAESAVNSDNRERVELKALQSAKQAEEEKRRQGKAEWWMKRSEKKKLLAKARLDAIASTGGRQAVKKAIEKKRKKVGQKEKKMRPFPRREEIEQPYGKKRRPADAVYSGVKRRRV